MEIRLNDSKFSGVMVGDILKLVSTDNPNQFVHVRVQARHDFEWKNLLDGTGVSNCLPGFTTEKALHALKDIYWDAVLQYGVIVFVLDY